MGMFYLAFCMTSGLLVVLSHEARVAIRWRSDSDLPMTHSPIQSPNGCTQAYLQTQCNGIATFTGLAFWKTFKSKQKQMSILNSAVGR